MRLLLLLVIIFLGRGTSAHQSCNNSPPLVLGCLLNNTSCNNGAGTCKDCCRSELGEIEMSSGECTGHCKCCGVPDENNCPVPLCGCGLGFTTETARDPITNCEKCYCVPETCALPPPCGCSPPYRTDYVKNSGGCLECQCVLECPVIDCPICESYEKMVHGKDYRGCSTCLCECREGSRWTDDCNTCTCQSNGIAICTLKACLPVQPVTCLPKLCGCVPGYETVETVEADGCPGCDCVPEPVSPVTCPQPFCACTDGLTPVLQHHVNSCPTCGCECPASICGCSPNDEQVEVLLPSGCKGCKCVPKQDSLCPEVQCLCNEDQNELHGVGADGCPFCICGGSCIEGSTSKQGCTTCTCTNGIIACTETGCLPPAPCPIAECPQCLQGQSPVYTVDSVTGCVTCSCSQVEICVEGHSKPSGDGCNTCTCVDGAYFCTEIDCSPLVCPEVLCPICSTDEKQSVRLEDGCTVCFCEACPQPLCVCNNGLTPVLEYHETDCPTCGCVQPEPCTRALCGCAPGFVTVEIVQADGCPGCACVPEPVTCPQPLCACNDGLTPVLQHHENSCPTCGCVEPETCLPKLCGCVPGYKTVETVEADGCPGCACVPEPVTCPQPFCTCTDGLTPVLQHHENSCPTCGCVQPVTCLPRLCGCVPGYETVETVEADGCPGCDCVPKPTTCSGGFCKSSCDFEAGEYVGPFSTCPAGQFCCSSPVTAPCANNGESCGAQCTCRTVCEQGEYKDGLCPTDLQDVGKCSKCKTCAEHPVCLFGCQGEQVIKTKRDEDGCLECECLCPPLDDCSPSCTRSLDESTGCFKCHC